MFSSAPALPDGEAHTRSSPCCFPRRTIVVAGVSYGAISPAITEGMLCLLDTGVNRSPANSAAAVGRRKGPPDGGADAAPAEASFADDDATERGARKGSAAEARLTMAPRPR